MRPQFGRDKRRVEEAKRARRKEKDAKKAAKKTAVPGEAQPPAAEASESAA